MKNDAGSEADQTIKADDFMKMLKISPNTFKKLLAEGRVPGPLPLGAGIAAGRVRWSWIS